MDATTPLERALDDPEREDPELDFLSSCHAGDLTHCVQSLSARCGGEPQPSSFEEDFLEIAHGLLLHHREIQAKIARIPAAKAATRTELFRRVERARVAALSPYHFHRAFTASQQMTPHA